MPIADAITILTTILPIASFINAFVYPNLLSEISSPNRLQRMSPVILQGIQAILTAVLATLLAEGFVPSPALECVLEDVWMAMFKSRNGLAIMYIQDTLQCCGLNTVNDRAYPFGNQTVSQCAEIYNRATPCRGPWESAMQLHSAIDFVVVVLVGMMQIFGLLMMQQGTNWWTTMRDDLETTQSLLAGDNGQDIEEQSYGTGEGGSRTATPPVERSPW